jgi:hypothetical protein
MLYFCSPSIRQFSLLHGVRYKNKNKRKAKKWVTNSIYYCTENVMPLRLNLGLGIQSKNEKTTDRRQCRKSVCEGSFIQNLRFSTDEFPKTYRRRRLRSRTIFSFWVVAIFRLHSAVPRGIINTCKSSNIFSWLYLLSTTYHC